MNISIFTETLIVLITSFISAWTSWFFARKKYNSEVDNNLIKNMSESLDFYKKLCDDIEKRLDVVLKDNEKKDKQIERLELELVELRKQMFNMMSSICTDITCKIRQRNLNLFNEHGTNSRQKVEETEVHHK